MSLVPFLDWTLLARYGELAMSPEVIHIGLTRRPLLPRRTATPAAADVLPLYYQTLFDKLGPQSWWPAKTPFEVIVGAILTQNTSWTNVERAIANLRRERLLTPGAIERVTFGRLAGLIRSSGYFRQKAKKLKAFVRFLRSQYSGSLVRMFQTPTAELREKLLAVHGIGPETADSILLYAGHKDLFVVDAYTKRIFSRHGFVPESVPYEELRALIESALPRDVSRYNEFHALLVQVGKNWCRPRKPRCGECPLRPFLGETP
jgi:endonuclease III related protein